MRHIQLKLQLGISLLAGDNGTSYTAVVQLSVPAVKFNPNCKARLTHSPNDTKHSTLLLEDLGFFCLELQSKYTHDKTNTGQ